MKMTHLQKLMMAGMLVVATGSVNAQNYCVPPPYQTGPYTGIVRVEVGTLDNATAYSDGLSDYTSSVNAPDLQAGMTYTIKVTTEHHIQNQGFTDKLNTRVWVDWNQDGDFIDAGEQILTSNSDDPGVVSAEFTVPAGAVNGETRMRVYEDMPVVDGHIAPNPCGYLNSSNFLGQHGECEDYYINVTGGSSVGVVNLTSQDIALSLYPNPANGSTNLSFNLNTKQDVSVTVYTLQGKAVKTVAVLNAVVGKQELKIDLAGIEKGFYLIKVEGNSTNATKKLLVN